MSLLLAALLSLPVALSAIGLPSLRLSGGARAARRRGMGHIKGRLAAADDDDAPDTANSAHDVEEDALESAAYL